MKKVLELEELWRTVEIVCFRISEQSHRGDDFGESTDNFIASNGVELESVVWPSFWSNLLFVRGSSQNLDKQDICCTIDEWERITEAVAEYNAFDFSDEDEDEEADVEKIVREVEIEGFKVTMIFEKKKENYENEY